MMELKLREDAPHSRDIAEWRDYLRERVAPGQSGTGNPTGNGAPAELPGDCPYDTAVVRGSITYADAEKREKVIGAIVENRQKAGELFTLDQMRERQSKLAKAVREAIDALPEMAAEMEEQHLRPQARERGKVLARVLLARVNEVLGARVNS